jgi:hypothetical protein
MWDSKQNIGRMMSNELMNGLQRIKSYCKFKSAEIEFLRGVK